MCTTHTECVDAHTETWLCGPQGECMNGLSSESPIVHVDPRLEAADFEEVQHREPSLDRARRLGLPLANRSMREIVRDTLREWSPVVSSGASARS